LDDQFDRCFALYVDGGNQKPKGKEKQAAYNSPESLVQGKVIDPKRKEKQ
jgi:hypothetical protein